MRCTEDAYIADFGIHVYCRVSVNAAVIWLTTPQAVCNADALAKHDSSVRCALRSRSSDATQFAHRIFDLLVAADPSSEEIGEAFAEIPDAMMATMKSELHELADADFYRRTFALGDTQAEAKVHADALARQAPLRRICAILTPLVLVRDRLDSQ